MDTEQRDLLGVKPHLKLGTVLLPGPDFSYVGRSERGLEVSSPARSALPRMDGSRTNLQLSEELGIPVDEILELVSELERAHLVDTCTSKISVHTRFHSPNAHRPSHDSDDRYDGAYQQLQARLTPELAATTWLPDVKDGGAAIVGKRQEWSVEIFGDGRIATSLYGILLASGLTKTTLRAHEVTRRIGHEDLCTGLFQPCDIGLPLEKRSRELAPDLSLFPIADRSSGKEKIDEPNSRRVMVAIGRLPADEIQKWMSQGIAHLIIGAPDGDSIDLGPMVVPGMSPCTRCVALSHDDQNPHWKAIFLQKALSLPREVPISIAHFVAGMAAIELLNFIDGGTNELIGASRRIHFRATLPTQESFALHPACGCNW